MTGTNTTGYRADINGLRAIAVLAVLAYHVGLPGVPGGFIGVDVFFVVSGFLITSLLIDEFRRSGSINMIGFYARRVRRLVPAALTVIVATVALSAVALSPFRMDEVGRANVGMCGNSATFPRSRLTEQEHGVPFR